MDELKISSEEKTDHESLSHGHHNFEPKIDVWYFEKPKKVKEIKEQVRPQKPQESRETSELGEVKEKKNFDFNKLNIFGNKKWVFIAVIAAIMVIVSGVSLVFLYDRYREPLFTGNIVVNSNPTGAKIFLDDKEFGSTPMTLNKIRTGKHIIRIEKDKYISSTGEVDVRLFDTSNFNSDLKWRAGKLTINSTPDKADVYIDGKHYRQTPVTIDDLDVAGHEIVLKKDQYNDLSQKIQLEEKPVTLELKMEKWKYLYSRNGKVYLQEVGKPAVSGREVAALAGLEINESRASNSSLVNGNNILATKKVKKKEYGASYDQNGYKKNVWKDVDYAELYLISKKDLTAKKATNVYVSAYGWVPNTNIIHYRPAYFSGYFCGQSGGPGCGALAKNEIGIIDLEKKKEETLMKAGKVGYLSYSFSSTGKYVYYYLGSQQGISEGTINILNLETRKETKINNVYPDGLVWSSDDKYLMGIMNSYIEEAKKKYGLKDKSIYPYRIDISTGSLTFLLKNGISNAEGAKLSPDNKYVLFQKRINDLETRLYTYSFSANEQNEVFPEASVDKNLNFEWSADSKKIFLSSGNKKELVFRLAELKGSFFESSELSRISIDADYLPWISSLEWSPNSNYVSFSFSYADKNSYFHQLSYELGSNKALVKILDYSYKVDDYEYKPYGILHIY